jgi:hypothetical protein
MVPTREIQGYGSKLRLIQDHAVGRRVLHLGAVGETCEETSVRVARARDSLHAHLTRVSEQCIGIDHDEPSVRVLTETGVFDNLLLADVVTLERSHVPMPAIDLIVAGDTIEHLSEPGRLLSVADKLADDHTKLLITTPNSLGLGMFLGNLRGRELEGYDHVCSFNAFTLSNLIERAGWRIEELWSCHQPTAAARTGSIFRLGRAVFERVPRLGGTLLAVCSRG